MEEIPARLLIHGDEGKLRQVLINLLSNAVRFTEKGSVTLRISTPRNEIAGDGEAKHFTFQVVDTGHGIPAEQQRTIFEPFQQSHDDTIHEGTGLGLTIAQKLVQLMGGQIEVESSPGVGSRFFFTIPLRPPQSDMLASQDDKMQHVLRLKEGYSVKALIADDIAENRDVLARILRDIDCDVIMAEDGRQAVEAVRNHRPDIAFMDIRMPVMDGLAATQEIIKEFGRGVFKFVAVSASAMMHQRETYLEGGFDAFIAKPIQAHEIYECLATLLHKGESGNPFEYDDDSILPQTLTDVELPEGLRLRLKEAAEIYSTSEIRRYIQELEQLGETAHPLATHLRELNQRSDMAAILELLDQLSPASSTKQDSKE